MRDRFRFLIRLAIAMAAGASLLPVPARTIESLYSSWLYPAWQPLVTRVSNVTSIALLDWALLGVIAMWIAAAVRDMARGVTRSVVTRIIVRTAFWVAACYVWFLVAWGLNYRRVPLIETVQFDASAVSPERARALATATVARLNQLYPDAHVVDGALPDSAVDPSLAAAFTSTLRALGRPTAFLPGRPKHTLLDPYFRRAGVDGMTDPYFLETLVVADLLPVERSFVIAHEWSHLAGIADEGEANFVGWLTCLRGTPSHQYSGALALYAELGATVRGRERSQIAAQLGPGPRSDLLAIARRQQQIDTRIATVGWRIYDSYLKANHVESGTASYAEMVRLVLGVRTTPDGTPLRR
jgi:hypothetical protein